MERKIERERHIESNRQRERERERDRQTDRHGERDRQTDHGESERESSLALLQNNGIRVR